MTKFLLTVLLFFIVASIQATTVAQPPKLAGYYRSKSGCNLSVRITHSGKQYFYTLKLNTRTRRGKLKLVKADEPGTTGIVFTGLRWAAYPSGKPPIGIEGVWTTTGIIIQNYGNAMNNYTQLAGCNEKYIELALQ